MAGRELIVDDEFFKAAGKFFEEQGNLLDTEIIAYIKILEEVKRQGLVKGETATGLASFIKHAEKMKGQVKQTSASLKKLTTNYIKAIDKADQYLF